MPPCVLVIKINKETNQPINMNKTLDLTKFLRRCQFKASDKLEKRLQKPNMVYKLKGMICQDGHGYTCILKRQQKWIFFNDGNFKEMTKNEVKQYGGEKGYMYFYETK